MMGKYCFSSRENVRILSVLYLSVLYWFFPNFQVFLLGTSWVFIQICMGNVKRIPKTPLVLYSIRMTLYFLPYIVPSVIVYAVAGKTCAVEETNGFIFTIGFAVALVIYFIWLGCNLKRIRILVSKDYAIGAQYIEKSSIVLMLYTMIGAAICEELFFRQFILSIDAPMYVILPTSVCLFVLAHWTLPWGRVYRTSDLISEVLVGIVNGVLFLVTKTVLLGMILHLLINLTTNANWFVLYDRWHLRKEYYDKIEIASAQIISDDLEL